MINRSMLVTILNNANVLDFFIARLNLYYIYFQNNSFQTISITHLYSAWKAIFLNNCQEVFMTVSFSLKTNSNR